MPFQGQAQLLSILEYLEEIEKDAEKDVGLQTATATLAKHCGTYDLEYATVKRKGPGGGESASCKKEQPKEKYTKNVPPLSLPAQKPAPAYADENSNTLNKSSTSLSTMSSCQKDELVDKAEEMNEEQLPKASETGRTRRWVWEELEVETASEDPDQCLTKSMDSCRLDIDMLSTLSQNILTKVNAMKSELQQKEQEVQSLQLALQRKRVAADRVQKDLEEAWKLKIRKCKKEHAKAIERQTILVGQLQADIKDLTERSKTMDKDLKQLRGRTQTILD